MERAEVVEENEVDGNQEYKKREFNRGAKQKNQTPIMYPSDGVECPTSSANVYGDRLESTSLCTPMSLVASGPPNFNPFSTNNTGVPVEELTARNCGIQINEGMHSELGCWPHMYKMDSMPRSKSAHDDNVSRDKGQKVLHAREDMRRMSSDSRNQNIFSRMRFNRDPEAVSAQLTNGYNKIMSNSSLQFGNSLPKILPMPNFSQLFQKKALKDKVIVARAQQSHAIPVADMVQNDNRQDSSRVLDSSGTQPSDEGISLREWLSAHSRYDKVEGLILFKKIVEIVDCAHSQGMVLQKLRPSHFMLSSPDVAKYSGPLTMADVDNAGSFSTAKKRSLEQGTFGCQCFVSKQPKYNDAPVSVKHTAHCRYFCGSGSVNEVPVDSPNLLRFRHNACSSSSNSSRQNSLLVNSQLEENWYISPEELSGRGCSLPSNIYALGVLLFELLSFSESSPVHSATLSNFRDRVLPPKMLSQHPIEMVFCLRMSHPEALSRPSIRQVLQSELLNPMDPSVDESLPSIHKEDSESELLIDFLTALDEQKQKQASKLVDEIWFLEEDMKDVVRRNMKMSSDPSCTNRESSGALSHKMQGKDPLGSGLLHGSLSEPNLNNPKLLRDITRLEKTYFSLRSKIKLKETQPKLRIDKHLLKSCVSEEGLHQEPADVLGDFFEGLCKYACYSKLEVCGTLKTGDVFSSANVICSLSFDRDEDFIATAGVSKKIKIFEFDALVNDLVDIHYPVMEMTNNSRLSCLCWNSYIKNYLASTDYEGTVQIWDGSTGQGLSRFSEHQKRSWSVDFSQVDPKRFASGSDDCSVKLWRINEKSSTSTLPNPANVCCVQFSPTTANLLAFGSADYKLYCYDLRHTRIPWCTLAGHGKTVSNVKFLNSDTLVSSSTDGTLKLWDLKKTNPCGLSLDACTLTFNGHTNVKNFVGLSVLDGYIACGSETNEVYAYNKSLPMPVTSYKFGSTDPLSGHGIAEDNAHVSSVCWRRKSNMIVAANSTGSVKLLRMV